MKKSMFMLTIPALLSASLFFTSCSTSADKVEDAKEDVTGAKSDLQDAREDLQDANQEYLADVESYRRETAAKIEANNQSLIAFNTQIKNESMEARADYRRQLDELERKNDNMRSRMDDYKVNGQSNWESFKKEYNRDMDALGVAFKNLTVDNVK